MAKKAPKQSGSEAFLEYYRQFFENDQALQTWLDLLETKPDQVWLGDQSTTESSLPWFPQAATSPSENLYGLNPSSLIPVLALNPQPGDLVLDACAAPGGKSLAIAEKMGELGHLVANDVSQARRHRLQATLHQFGHTRSEVWGQYAEKIHHQYPEHFDKILLDAPCSSEKHIYANPKELTKWTTNRPHKLAKRQLNLLHQVWQALKPGGRLVYSTCAVTPEENEQVVATFLAGHEDAQLIPITLPPQLENALATATTSTPQISLLSGTVRINASDKFDPMFVSLLEKKL